MAEISENEKRNSLNKKQKMVKIFYTHTTLLQGFRLICKNHQEIHLFFCIFLQLQNFIPYCNIIRKGSILPA